MHLLKGGQPEAQRPRCNKKAAGSSIGECYDSIGFQVPFKDWNIWYNWKVLISIGDEMIWTVQNEEPAAVAVFHPPGWTTLSRARRHLTEQYASMFSRAVNGKKGGTLPTIPLEGTLNRLDTNTTRSLLLPPDKEAPTQSNSTQHHKHTTNIALCIHDGVLFLMLVWYDLNFRQN